MCHGSSCGAALPCEPGIPPQGRLTRVLAGGCRLGALLLGAWGLRAGWRRGVRRCRVAAPGRQPYKGGVMHSGKIEGWEGLRTGGAMI